MSPSATVWIIDVILIIFGQQWSTRAQWNELYQPDYTNNSFWQAQFISDLVFLWDLLQKQKI